MWEDPESEFFDKKNYGKKKGKTAEVTISLCPLFKGMVRFFTGDPNSKRLGFWRPPTDIGDEVGLRMESPGM